LLPVFFSPSHDVAGSPSQFRELPDDLQPGISAEPRNSRAGNRPVFGFPEEYLSGPKTPLEGLDLRARILFWSVPHPSRSYKGHPPGRFFFEILEKLIHDRRFFLVRKAPEIAAK
jgi:hypothetical protein